MMGSCGYHVPTPTTLSPKHRRPSSVSFFFHNSRATIPCSATDDASTSPSSTHSYSPRWYNPLRREQYDQTSPDMLRRWIEADQPLASQERFTVVSYNILGDRKASKHRDLYPNVPSVYMKGAHRKRVICEDLIGWNPDIICLQEVDNYFDLLNEMEKAGYAGSYKRRTGDKVDGCAMFWKADSVRLLEGESIEFKELATICF